MFLEALFIQTQFKMGIQDFYEGENLSTNILLSMLNA